MRRLQRIVSLVNQPPCAGCLLNYDPFSWPGRSARAPRLNGWIYAAYSNIGNPSLRFRATSIVRTTFIETEPLLAAGVPRTSFLNTRQMARKSTDETIGKGKNTAFSFSRGTQFLSNTLVVHIV